MYDVAISNKDSPLYNINMYVHLPEIALGFCYIGFFFIYCRILKENSKLGELAIAAITLIERTKYMLQSSL